MAGDGMMFDRALSQLVTKAGIKRDGTTLDGSHYTDGVWTRFRLGRPKKMGGYREITNGLNGPIRGMISVSRHPEHVVFMFSNSGVQCQIVDVEGISGGTFDRTPAAFVSRNYTWTYDSMYDSSGTPSVKIIAHAARTNYSDLDDDAALPVWIGESTASTPLTEISGQAISGGLVVLQPFLFIYGSNGQIKNSAANKPSDFITGDANNVNVSGSKIVKGLPLRGGANAPAGLFWALDSLIRVSYIGGAAKWRYDTVAGNSSVLCSNGMVDYDGVFYWPGVDRFLMYNGVVKEVPNFLNQDFFFDNLNWNHRQKVWGTILHRWGEIWWFFPKGDATECNHAVIYNVRENTWYDTPIARSAGVAPRVMYFPIWADSAHNSDGGHTEKYRIYRHETGTDAVFNERATAIRAAFETNNFSLATGGLDGSQAQTPNTQTRITRVEPDFVMEGAITATVIGSSHSQATDTSSDAKSFTSSTPFIDFHVQQRVMRMRFESNATGGDFHMGRVLAHIEPGDQRQ